MFSVNFREYTKKNPEKLSLALYGSIRGGKPFLLNLSFFNGLTKKLFPSN